MRSLTCIGNDDVRRGDNASQRSGSRAVGQVFQAEGVALVQERVVLAVALRMLIGCKTTCEAGVPFLGSGLTWGTCRASPHRV